MRLIDAHALYREYQEKVCDGITCNECKATNKDGTCKLDLFISTAPTIDAVQVVRCKDCKQYHYYTEQFSLERRGDGLCHRCHYVMNDDDFCSYGERRER